MHLWLHLPLVAVLLCDGMDHWWAAESEPALSCLVCSTILVNSQEFE